MKVYATFKWDKPNKKKLEELPDKAVYAIARATLDQVGSMQITPYLTGNMERTMYSAGVRKGNYGYYIGDFTDYASYVYQMPQRTNWTRSSSRAHWFKDLWTKKGEAITNETIARYKL